MVKEVGSAPFLLPAHHIEDALSSKAAFHGIIADETVPALATFCIGRFSRGHDRYAAEVAVAAKSPKGRRPVHVLSFEQRVLYRALVEQLEEALPEVDRSDDAWLAFQNGPLEDESYRYIVRTDIVGFYQFIDHAVLIDEVVARTGSASAAEEIASFLGSAVGSRGLPQNMGPSHVLAEYYLDAVERGLLRSGHPVWRFSDDFMLAGASWAAINSGLAELSDRLRSVGLVINEEKTRFFRQETYREWIDHPLERLHAGGGSDLLAVVSEYDPDEPPDDEDRQLELQGSQGAAVDLIDRCLAAHTADSAADRLDVAVNRKVVRGALRLLSLLGSPDALGFVPNLLRFEPQLTPAVARYLAAISSTAQQELVRATVATTVVDQDLFLSSWQASWLIQPLLRTGSHFEPVILEWLRAQLLCPLSVTRARAAEALAWPDQVDVLELTQLYEASPPASRPDFAVAIALRCWDPTAGPVVSVARDSPFNALVINAVRPLS